MILNFLNYYKYKKNYKIIKESKLFDEKYYFFSYKDIRFADIDPIKHYILYGAKEGRNPNSTFNTKWYINTHNDVLQSAMNPFSHYIQYGRKEGRSIQAQNESNNNTHISTPRHFYSKLLTHDCHNKIAIIIHLEDKVLWDNIYKLLTNINVPYKLYITTTQQQYNEIKQIKIPTHIEHKVLSFPLSHHKTLSFLKVIHQLDNDIKLFCKIHLQTYSDDNQQIQQTSILNQIIGSNEICTGIINAFETDKDLSLVGPALSYVRIDKEAFIDNNIDTSKYGFFINSTFWGSVNMYKSLSLDDIDTFSYKKSEMLLGLVPFKTQSNTALVYPGNDQGDFYLEKLLGYKSVIENIALATQNIVDFDKNINLLQDFKSFDDVRYLTLFAHLRSHGIESKYHYLARGHEDFHSHHLELYQKNNTSKDNTYIHVLLYGAIYQTHTFDRVQKEYAYIATRMSIKEAYLIDWNAQKFKQRKKDFISIVIPLYGQAQLTENCLESIFSTPAGCEFELILVNNSQSEKDRTALDKWRENPHIKIIQNSENLNFALGCNLGFSRSIGEQVVFLNNDTTVTENWLLELITPLANENISSVQPKLLYPDETLQCMGIVFSDESDIGYPIYQNQDISHNLINKPRSFQAITAACMALNAEDFILVNGFDTNFVNGQEDVDLCLRLNSIKNTMSYYAPKSTVYHYEGKSAGRGKFVAQNRQTFLSRWRDKIVSDDKSYYALDNYTVEKYIIDNTDYEAVKLETHVPKLKKSIYINASKQDNKNNFSITTSIKHKNDAKTVLVSTHVLSKVLYGGQRSFLDMVQALFHAGHNVIVTLPNNGNLKYIEMLSEYCTKIYIVNYSFWSTNGLNNSAVDLLELIMRKNLIDLVYVNTIVCREPLMAAKRVGIPKVIHIREIITSDEALRKTIGIEDSHKILEEVKRNADVLICNSVATSKLFDDVGCEIIYNRVDITEFSAIKKRSGTKIRFGIISGNEPKKGIFDFLEVAKRCQNIEAAEFLIIGHKNSHIKKIEKEIKLHKLKNLKLLGYYDSPLEAISECDVVVSLSHFAESFGRTVAEAMAGKKAVISYRWGAVPELIDHDNTGILCEYKNIDEVVEAVNRLCSNPTVITEMGEKGCTRIKKLSDTPIYNEGIKKAIEVGLHINTKSIVMASKPHNTVIIPIYNAYEEVSNCIDSVINTVDNTTEILLIDDCSSDIRIEPLLQKYTDLDNVSVYHNQENIGYTRNINKAIQLAKGEDIVLLNSDTITTSSWLESMQKVAYSDKDIGTVTAMSDNAGAFSFPPNANSSSIKPDIMTYNNYAELIIRQTEKLPNIHVPTGSGFCLYIKRALLKDIGLFDEILFPRGYGEENDFCLRAINAGWKNVISTKTFIFHIRSASFKDEKKALIAVAKVELLKKYPDYTERVKEAFNSEPIYELNREATEALSSCNITKGS